MNSPRTRRAGLLPSWQRVPTHVIFAICAVSGVLFFLKHELQFDLGLTGGHGLLVAHGVSAAFALLAFGAVLPGHLRAAWMARRNRASGVLMLVVMSVLMMSGLLLYYGSEEIRDGVVTTHWVVGFAAFAAFLLHILIGRHDQPPARH